MPLFNPDWLNENESRAYPFKTGVTLTNSIVTLPKNFIVDAVFGGTDSERRYRVQFIEVDDDFIQVGIGDDEGVYHGIVNIQTDALDENYLVGFFQPLASSPLKGKFVFGPGREEVSNFTNDRYFFGFEAAELEPTVCIPNSAPVVGVTSLREFGTTKPERVLSGDVQIQAGKGIAIDFDPATNTIRIAGAKDYDCGCPDDFNRIHPCRKAIKTINGVPPREDDGNIDIMQGEWIYVIPRPADHQVEIGFVGDVDCCCDACDELESLREALQAAAASVGP